MIFFLQSYDTKMQRLRVHMELEDTRESRKTPQKKKSEVVNFESVREPLNSSWIEPRWK